MSDRVHGNSYCSVIEGTKYVKHIILFISAIWLNRYCDFRACADSEGQDKTSRYAIIIIGYYGMYQWRAKARMRSCAGLCGSAHSAHMFEDAFFAW